MTMVKDVAALMRALTGRRTLLCLRCLVAAAAIPVDRAEAALRELRRHVILLQEPGCCTACRQAAEVYSLMLSTPPA
jgi:hypothetical protein